MPRENTQFKNGHKGYWFGKKQPKDLVEKRRLKMIGKPATSGCFKRGHKIKGFLGKHHTKCSIDKISVSNKGKKRSEETRKKISISLKGHSKPKNAYSFPKGHKINWIDGSSFLPYIPEFNKEKKLKIRTRDDFICKLCGRTEREELEELNRVLCIHHIDFNKKNCEENNLITLCLRCNVKVNRLREYWTDYFQNILV